MTPQHRLAVEIMSECGMTPHEIAVSFDGEGACMPLFKIEKVIRGKENRAGYKPSVRRDHLIEYRGAVKTAGEWMAVNNLSRQLISERRRHGWRLGRAFGEPSMRSA